MKGQTVAKLSLACLISSVACGFSSYAFAEGGALFSVTPAGGDISITLCLNNHKISCQKYRVPSSGFSVRTVAPNHVYPIASIKVNTPGFNLAGCTPTPAGYCTFSVSSTNPKSFSLFQYTPKVAVAAVNSVSADAGLATTSNGGTNWTLPKTGAYTLTSSSCVGSGSSATCLAVGITAGITYPVVLRSVGGGEWQELPRLAHASTLRSVSCTLNSGATICSIAGVSDDGPPLLYVTNNAGDTWTRVTSPLPSTGSFKSTSCATTGSDTVCVAGGQTLTGTLPILIISTDGGTTWANANGVPNIAGFFNQTSCSGPSGSGACIAVGSLGTGGSALVLYTNNPGAATWTNVNTGALTSVTLNAASCTGQNVCVAAGEQTAGSKFPALFYTSNAGGAWSARLGNVSGRYTGVGCSGTNCAASGNLLAPNTAPLLDVSTNNTASWNSVDVSSMSGNFRAASCTGTGNTGVCVAAGNSTTNGTTILYVSQDGGSTWALNDTASLFGIFQAVNCSGTGSNAACTAVGSVSTKPVVYFSADSGYTWSDIPLATQAGLLNAASCTGKGANAICTAVGQDLSVLKPIIYRGTTNGKVWSWSQVNLNAQDKGTLIGVSCVGSGATATCVASGRNNTTTLPLVYVSRNGGASWQTKATTNNVGIFNTASCTGPSGSATCVVAGQNRQDAANPLPLLYVSTNSGSTWQLVNTGTNKGAFRAAGTSCTGSGSNAVCIASGEDLTTNLPLLYVSNTGVTSWSPVATTTNEGLYDGASCAGSGNTATCVVSGADNITTQTLLYFSRNGGVSWTAIPSLTPPARGGAGLYGSSCTGVGAESICVSGGYYFGEFPPVVYLGKALGTTSMLWSSIPPIAPQINLGYFFRAMCKGAGNAATCILGGQANTAANTVINAPVLYITHDSGTNWVANSIPTAIGYFSDVAGVRDIY